MNKRSLISVFLFLVTSSFSVHAHNDTVWCNWKDISHLRSVIDICSDSCRKPHYKPYYNDEASITILQDSQVWQCKWKYNMDVASGLMLGNGEMKHIK